MLTLYILGVLITLALALFTGRNPQSKLIAISSIGKIGILPRKEILLFVIYAIFPLSILSALRVQVGSDYYLYVQTFKKIDLDSFSNSRALIDQDPGFVLIQFILRQMTERVEILFFVITFLTLIFFFLGCYLKSNSYAYSFFIYFFMGHFVFSLNGMRQSLAVSILFYAESIENKRSLRYFLCVLLAVSIHSTSLFAFLTFRVADRIVFSLRSQLISIAFVVVSLTAVQFDSISKWIDAIQPRYLEYNGSSSAGIGTLLNLGVKLGLFYVCWIFARDIESRSYLNRIFIGQIFLALALNSVIMARFEYYYSIYWVLLIPRLARNQNLISKMFFHFMLPAILLTYFGFHVTFYNGVLPLQLGTWVLP